MSYILDALRKADQQRQQGAAPTLSSVQLPAEEAGPRVLPWLLGLAATVFIAGILIGWLQPWKAEPPPGPLPAVEAFVAKAPATAPQPLPRHQPVPPAPPLPAPAPVAAVAMAPAPVQTPPAVARPAMPAVVAATPPVVAVRTPAAAATPEPVVAAAAKSAPVPEQKVMAKAELPPAIQQELPAMSVSLHAYSAKPGNRLVSINNQLLNEGDSLTPGLVLQEITRQDMIFSYKGYRFRQSVQ